MCVIQLKASFQETENSITVRSKKPTRIGCIFHIDVFFFPLDIRTRPPVFQISQVVSSHSQAASSILLQINKVTCFLTNFFLLFYFSCYSRHIGLGAPPYLSAPRWQKVLLIYQIRTASLLQESSYQSYFFPVALQWLQMGLSLSGLVLMSGGK